MLVESHYRLVLVSTFLNLAIKFACYDILMQYLGAQGSAAHGAHSNTKCFICQKQGVCSYKRVASISIFYPIYFVIERYLCRMQ